MERDRCKKPWESLNVFDAEQQAVGVLAHIGRCGGLRSYCERCYMA